MKEIVYTRPDGGVTLCQPAPELFKFMTRGGGYYEAKGISFSASLEVNLQEFGKTGVTDDVIVRHAKALAFGGLTDAEVYEVTLERDCRPYGTGFEVWDRDELPDRWFRDAWHRSANGGPVSIDMRLAVPLQAGYIKKEVERINRERKKNCLLIEPPPFVPNYVALEQQLRNAKDETELRRVTIEEFDYAR